MTVELERAIASQVQALEPVSSLAVEEPVELLRRASRIWLVGTGTSQHAAELGALLLADLGVDARAAGSLHFSQWLPAVGKDEAEGVAVSRIDSPVSLNPVLAQVPLTVSVQRLALRWAHERGQNADLAIVGAWADEALWSLGSRSD